MISFECRSDSRYTESWNPSSRRSKWATRRSSAAIRSRSGSGSPPTAPALSASPSAAPVAALARRTWRIRPTNPSSSRFFIACGGGLPGGGAARARWNLGIALALRVGHLADHQRSALHLLTYHLKLLLALLLGALTRGLHEVSTPSDAGAGEADRKRGSQRRSRTPRGRPRHPHLIDRSTYARTRATLGLGRANPLGCNRSAPRFRSRCSRASSAFRSAHDRRNIHMATGTVKWFSDDKGFGFITPDDSGKDLFVHHSGIESDGYKSLAEGAKVSYEEEAGPKGPKAVSVLKI